jgi:YVTN family beta-propeller protein
VAVGFGSLWVTTNHGELVRVDPTTNRVLAKISVGSFPVGIVEGFGSMWQANHDDGTLDRIDPTSNRVIATIPVGPGPAQLAVAGGMVWVANTDSTLARIDPATNRRAEFVRVGAGNQFRAIVAAAGSVWTNNHNAGVARIDAKTGRTVAAIDVSGCCDGDLMFARGAVWATNPDDGRLIEIDPATDRVTQQFHLERGARGLAFAGGRYWVSYGDASLVSWHATDTWKKLGSVLLDGYVGNMVATDDRSIWIQTLDRAVVTRLTTG